MTIDCIMVDDDPKTSDMVIDTYDLLSPGAAKVEVSDDGNTWVEVHGKALNDCNE